MKQITLPNGIRCLLQNTKCHQSITVNIMFRVGSRDEPQNYYGLTHFAEHMFFKGTKNRPEARMISGEIDQYGGELNAATDYDVTYYYIKIDYRHLSVALDILSDLLFNATFLQKDINNEKEVVVNELKLVCSNPSRQIETMMANSIYEKTSLEHDVGGDVKKIRKATRNQFLHYISNFYQPNHVVLTIVGHFPTTEKKVISMVRNCFNRKFDYKNQIPTSFKANPIKFLSSRKKFPDFMDYQKVPRFHQKVVADISNSYLMVGFPSWKYHCQKYYATLVLSTILGSGMSSRLFTAVREKNGLVYKIKSNVDAYEDVGSFTIHCGTHYPEKVYQLIINELNDLKAGNLTLPELKKAQEQLIGFETLRSENTSYLAQILTYHYITTGKIKNQTNYLKCIKDVKLSEVISVANELFQPHKMNICLITPQKFNPKLFT